MHERKATMLQNVDAVIALPGGVGTLDELLEIICWKKLGLFLKPIIIINTDGYFDPLFQMLHNCVNENFMGKVHLDLWSVVNDTKGDAVVEAIRTAVPWTAEQVGKITELL